MPRVLGVLGGMGPYATLDFLRHLYDLTPNVAVDSDHIRVLADINVKIPSRTRAVKYGEESPVDMMVESIEALAAQGAAFVAVPCNSAHYFYDVVEERTTISWVNMLSVVADEVSECEPCTPLILGGFVTVSKEVYSDVIPNAIYLDDEGNEIVFDLIEALKIADDHHLEIAIKLLERCKNCGVDTIVLACTELTEVASLFEAGGFRVIDTNRVYAKAVVELATG